MSEEPEAPAPAGPTVPCKFCREPIPRGARYCTHCEKFQSPWDRFTWGASLTSVVTLISVVSLAYGFISQQVKKTEPQVVLTPVACSIEEVKLALSNLGDQPALFQGGDVSLAAGGHADARTLVAADVPQLLAAQSNKIEALQVASTKPPHLPLPFDAAAAQAPGCQMRLNLSWTDGHNRKHSDVQSCGCSS